MPDHTADSELPHRRGTAAAPGAPAEPPAPCVVVLGMHRSGTSATSGALRLFGIGMPNAGDLVVGRGNDRGHFESRSLTAFDDRLLGLLHGAWDRPPSLRPGWEHSPALDEARSFAPATFRVAFGAHDGPVAWKDPRLSLLLPFWRSVLDRPVVAILACRDPIEVAASLEARDGYRPALGLALWDRYQRSSLECLAGLPVYVTHYERALEDRELWAAELATFLRRAGVKVSDPEPDALADWLDPALRRQRRDAGTGGAPAELLPGQAALAAHIEALSGQHEVFEPSPLPEPDDWVSEVLDARSDAAASWNGLLWAARALEEHASRRIAPRLGVPAPRRRGSRAGPRTPYPPNATEDRQAYRDWLEARGLPLRLPSRAEVLADRSRTLARTKPPAGGPRFSILVPVYRPPLWVLQRCVASVLDQTYASFELCLCDDASGDAGLTKALAELARLDPRVKVTASPRNGGISAATNGALALAGGEFVVFLDNDDELAPRALEAMAEAIERDPLADVLYSDEDKTDESGELFSPSFKPGWAPDTLLSSAYLCHLFVVRRSLVAELGGLRSEFDGSQDYDLMLRATEQARNIVHVPEILYHWRMIEGSAAGDTSAKPWAYEAGRRALEDAMARRGEEAVVDARTVVAGTYHVRRRVVGKPLVSIVVPFRDEPGLLTQCVESICEAPGYERFELVLVDNGSVLPETSILLDRLAEDPRVLLLEEPGPFNWSAMNNAAAAEAGGDLLLFMNNDVEATTDGWLLPMVEHAQRREVGAVGARLLYPNRTIQHAGVVLGLCDAAAHVLQDLPEDLPGYLAWAYMARNCTAVTGACMMTRRDVFDSLGGFSDELPIAFNDIDYCLRIRESGRLVVYTPLAELVHHESRTRGHTDDAVELPRFLARWAGAIIDGDPYHNEHLSRWRPWCPLSTPEEDERWTNFRSRLERLRER